jgi:hypothetical protein
VRVWGCAGGNEGKGGERGAPVACPWCPCHLLSQHLAPSIPSAPIISLACAVRPGLPRPAPRPYPTCLSSDFPPTVNPPPPPPRKVGFDSNTPKCRAEAGPGGPGRVESALTCRARRRVPGPGAGPTCPIRTPETGEGIVDRGQGTWGRGRTRGRQGMGHGNEERKGSQNLREKGRMKWEGEWEENEREKGRAGHEGRAGDGNDQREKGAERGSKGWGEKPRDRGEQEWGKRRS